ncbi:MAG TPA: bifunctional phosphoribosyl-AMP cyclohydrolase/phosphoribosyl-ATP diphosphatase HisIE [Solirubrobacterales bacterium]|nr:bifunctional phosphoribosyl-AMP cyclohydrolase/phosphoribosyl-ATP diphosphatase HisIE [Solirubrobacterales bacterium]
MRKTPEELAIRFGDDGLVPCVVQDSRTGEILTLAYMNEEAYGLTLETREVHFWSRSRQELWRKGATSGNTLALEELRVDCDGDALVALAVPAGPACHTGERSCFYRDAESGGTPEPALHETLAGLERTLRARQTERPEGSYTAKLLDDPALIGEKVREEAEEVTRAAREEPDERVASEAADVLYHLSVLLRSRDVSLASVFEVLRDRSR